MENQYFDIFYEKELSDILDQFQKARDKRSDFELGFNIFSLVSDTYYKENFHSDIIAALLNPEEKHNEGRKFLDLFFDLIEVDKSNYEIGLEVKRECRTEDQRRIDILITSQTHAVIIENKLNNAIDTDNQLVAYYKDCTEDKRLKVDKILYLSLDGQKQPYRDKWDTTLEIKNKIEGILIRPPAFDIPSEKTIYGWLDRCVSVTSDYNNIFVIKQYQKLLKSLRGYIMETQELEKYYDWISTDKAKGAKIEKWVDIHNSLFRYYPQKLVKEINSDPSIGLYFKECRIYDPEPGKNYKEVLIEGIGNSDYYLKIRFTNNKVELIYLMDNYGGYQHNLKLSVNERFFRLFYDDGDGWVLKETKYDLIGDFYAFSQDVKSILRLISEIITTPL